MASDRADPIPLHIQDRNSLLFLEYKPNSTYEVVIEERSTSNTQKWLVIPSGFVDYFYIQSVHNNYVISAGMSSENPLFCAPKKSGLERTQLWILRAPDQGTNSHYTVMNARTGLVMDVWDKQNKPGTRVQVYTRSNGHHQQFKFLELWMSKT